MNDTDPEDGCQLDGSQVGPVPAGGEIDVVIAAYLQAVERGAAPDQRAILAEHPHLAAGLREFFADEGELCELLGQRSPAVPAVHATVATTDGVEPADAAWGGGGHDFLSGPAPRLGHYELLAELARGGMGIVYKARDTRLDRLVALKMILAGQFASAEDVRRFQVEAENAARLDHPNIVPIYEVGRRGGLHYFTMKLVEGGSLCDRQARFTADPPAVLELMARVADAVHYAHQRGYPPP